MMSWNSSSIRDRFKPILMPASKIADNLEMTALSNELSFDEIRDLGTHLKVFRIPEDDTLFAEGDTESYMGILIRGRVEGRCPGTSAPALSDWPGKNRGRNVPDRWPASQCDYQDGGGIRGNGAI